MYKIDPQHLPRLPAYCRGRAVYRTVQEAARASAGSGWQGGRPAPAGRDGVKMARVAGVGVCSDHILNKSFSCSLLVLRGGTSGWGARGPSTPARPGLNYTSLVYPIAFLPSLPPLVAPFRRFPRSLHSSGTRLSSRGVGGKPTRRGKKQKSI